MRTVQIPNDRLTECLEMMCAEYCYWPTNSASDEILKLHCEECPLNNINIDEYWEELNKAD